MPQPAAETDSREQSEAIRRVVRAVLAEEKQTALTNRGTVQQLLDMIKMYWPLILALVSVSVALVAWWKLGVSPMESYREMQQRKRQREYQQELARHHIELGNDFLNVGQPKAAAAEFNHAKELDSYNPDADLGLLKVSVFEPVAEKEYDPEVAQRRIQGVLNQHPNDTHAYAFMGDVFLEIDRKSALRYYDLAIASDKTTLGPTTAKVFWPKKTATATPHLQCTR